MGNVIFDISMSLDGFMTAAGQTAEEPMGKGGERLTEWAFGSDERDREILTTGVAGLGSVICGRRTYDTSLPWWGAGRARRGPRASPSSSSPTASLRRCRKEACIRSWMESSLRWTPPRRLPGTGTSP